MKKPILATVGIAGACAACCAIPIVVPLLSGLSVAGMLGIGWGHLPPGWELMAVGAGAVVALVVGLSIWTTRRRRLAAGCASSTGKRDSPASACGCDKSATAGGSV